MSLLINNMYKKYHSLGGCGNVSFISADILTAFELDT